VLLNEINGINNSDKFSRSYDYLYLDVTFLNTGYTQQQLVSKFVFNGTFSTNGLYGAIAV